jgi:cardiolipin synthase
MLPRLASFASLASGPLLLLGLVACAPLPARQAQPVALAPAQLAGAVQVSDAHGPLPPGAARQVAAEVAAEGRSQLALHHLGVLAAQGDAHLLRGNSAKLLVDGPQTFAAMRAAIASARARVLLESYIFEDEGLAAEVGELLATKAGQGVGVAVLYDALGSFGTSEQFFENLRRRGVSVCAFNPVNPVRRPGYWGINHRDHRKILVADDRVGFIGGINVSKVYASGSSGSSGAKGSSGLGSSADAADAPPNDKGWRDTQIELRGPVAPALAKAFEDHWRAQGCRDPLPAATRAATGNAGETTVQLLLTDPDESANPVYTSVLKAIDASRRSVHLTMAYFAPGPDMAQALCAAAQRGVDVVLILPSRSDFALILAAGRSYYTQLLGCGVHIHELQNALLHAKTAVIDGVWSTVGSSNLDWRSIVVNSEVNVVVLGDDFARVLEQQFERDLAASRSIEPQDWAQRGLFRRLTEQVGRIAERLL